MLARILILIGIWALAIADVAKPGYLTFYNPLDLLPQNATQETSNDGSPIPSTTGI